MLVFHEQNSVSVYFTKPKLPNSFIRFWSWTRRAATRCKSTRATLSPRMIRGDKVLRTDMQIVTATRVGRQDRRKASSVTKTCTPQSTFLLLHLLEKCRL
jgi:hypothetical protein